MVDFVSSTELGGITNLALAATVKDGFVDGLDTCSFVKRLDAVLNTLGALARASREAASTPGLPDNDFVGQRRIVHAFRFVIMPPDDVPPGVAPGRHRLILNVTFDAGWEPYMRVIWRDLGTMLDLMFCNCVGYPLAHSCRFEDYVAWVRAHELAGGFFYVDGTGSIADRRFLERRYAAEVQAAIVPPPPIATPTTPADQALAALRPMSAFFALAPIFPANAVRDSDALLRSTCDILRGLGAADLSRLLPADVKSRNAAMLAWYQPPPTRQVEQGGGLPTVVHGDVQGGILESYDGITWGCRPLHGGVDGPRAAAALAAWPVTTAADASAPAALRRNIALTFGGLRALEVPESVLAKLPQEFVDGMAARAGVLGDVRGNHPDRWRLPERYWPTGSARPEVLPPVDLATVDVAIQLRGPQPGDWRAELAPLLAQGLEVLAVQPLVRYPSPADPTNSREHFGFEDGFSQPHVGPKNPSLAFDDAVPAGEILLGHANERGDGRVPGTPDPLLDNGSFLVVRKLSQRVEVLNRVVAKAASLASVPDLMSRMMGREPDGTPRVDPPLAAGANDFNFSKDPDGAVCPVQAHIRRANPRDPVPLPRIMRRGMSYGPRFEDEPEAARGLVFMAYNASIAEQFEKIQRWICSSTPAGGHSAHVDPFIGVPDPARTRPFVFEAGGREVIVDLGPDPFVVLEWGLYLFAPSVSALKWMARAAADARGAVTLPADPPTDSFDGWQRILEDGATRDAAWASVRTRHGGVLRTDYGVLVGDPVLVRKVFADQENYSVRGYGQRMSASIGLGYLGQDSDAGHDEPAAGSNRALARVTEREAFDLASGFAARCLTDALGASGASPGQRQATIDLGSLGETVLAKLCASWFGFPDGRFMVEAPTEPAAPTSRCPAHLLAASRFIFTPRPTEMVRQVGGALGHRVLEAVSAGLAAKIPMGPVSLEIQAALAGLPPGPDNDLVARTIGGAMLGFAPTTYGNLRNVATAWLRPGVLSDLQTDLLAARRAAAPGEATCDIASRVLRTGLLTAMLKQPVPDMLWRIAKRDHQLGPLSVREGEHIVVGLLSASQLVTDPQSSEHYVIFGGNQSVGETLHACPGYAMAIGTLLGVFCAVLEAGALRPAGGLALTITA
jgi:Dyp-type peroxidase family